MRNHTPLGETPEPAAENDLARLRRGLPWVIAQITLIGLSALSAARFPHIALWPLSSGIARSAAGNLLVLVGVAIALWARYTLGRSFSPLPEPAATHALVTRGPYRVVRHPIYLASVVLALGFALQSVSFLALVFPVALAFVVDRKANIEEQVLVARYPRYRDQMQRVRKLIPWLY